MLTANLTSGTTNVIINSLSAADLSCIYTNRIYTNESSSIGNGYASVTYFVSKSLAMVPSSGELLLALTIHQTDLVIVETASSQSKSSFAVDPASIHTMLFKFSRSGALLKASNQQDALISSNSKSVPPRQIFVAYNPTSGRVFLSLIISQTVVTFCNQTFTLDGYTSGFLFAFGNTDFYGGCRFTLIGYSYFLVLTDIAEDPYSDNVYVVGRLNTAINGYAPFKWLGASISSCVSPTLHAVLKFSTNSSTGLPVLISCGFLLKTSGGQDDVPLGVTAAGGSIVLTGTAHQNSQYTLWCGSLAIPPAVSGTDGYVAVMDSSLSDCQYFQFVKSQTNDQISLVTVSASREYFTVSTNYFDDGLSIFGLTIPDNAVRQSSAWAFYMSQFKVACSDPSAPMMTPNGKCSAGCPISNPSSPSCVNPRNLQVSNVGSSSFFQVSWDVQSSALSAAFGTYVVYWWDARTDTWSSSKLVVRNNSVLIDISSLQDSTRFYVGVQSVDLGLTKGNSSIVTNFVRTTPVPSVNASSISIGSVSSTSFTVSFQGPQDTAPSLNFELIVTETATGFTQVQKQSVGDHLSSSITAGTNITLLPGHLYNVSVVVVDGTYRSSPSGPVTTVATVPLPPFVVSVVSSTSTTVSVGYSASPVSPDAQEFYNITYIPKKDFDSGTAGMTILPGQPRIVLQQTVQHLVPGTVYRFHVVTSIFDSLAMRSSEYSSPILACTAVKAISNIAVVGSEGVDTAVVSWAAPVTNDAPITGYQANLMSNNQVLSSFDTLDTNIEFRNLTSNTTYYIQVKTKVCSGSGSTYSEAAVVTFTTKPPSTSSLADTNVPAIVGIVGGVAALVLLLLLAVAIICVGSFAILRQQRQKRSSSSPSDIELVSPMDSN